MPQRDPRDSLTQMRDHALEAVKLAQAMVRTDLEQDRLRELALVRLVEIVGEAAGRLPPDWRAEHPGVAWAEIIGMRHRLAHGYDEIDLDVLWAVVSADLPEVVRQIEEILESPS